jgi:hypothetical protein
LCLAARRVFDVSGEDDPLAGSTCQLGPSCHRGSVMSLSERARVPQWKTSSDLGWPGRGGRSSTVVAYLIIAGWPLIFWPLQSQLGTAHWLSGLAIPWWIMVGGITLLVIMARALRGIRKGRPAIRG